MELWEKDSEKTKPHWLEVNDPEGWWSAIVKWDGCIHLQHYGNIPLTSDPLRKDESCCDDYIHICDLDDYIKRLESLKEKAIQFYASHGKKWPG